MYRVVIEKQDVKEIEAVVGEVAATFSSVEDPDFQRVASEYAQELPRSLRAELNNFRLTEPHGALVISGYPVDDASLGPTPGHWKDRVETATHSHAVYFFLVGCLLGDPIAWSTQQAGRILHDVVPIRGDEYAQVGSNSEEPLTWHTEDAFHPLRTDYVGLLCLRNPDNVETTYTAVRDLMLDGPEYEALWEERFPIRPDSSHFPDRAVEGADAEPETERLRRRSYEWITWLVERPERIAVLFGDRSRPYLRLDPFFMERAWGDPEAEQALKALETSIEGAMTSYVLAPGEVLILDNYSAVHGRRPFTARFDGSDRWLKRLNIARDLRKSRASRQSAGSRTIF
ncbi:guanitoxin biosynthesis L-enduracididine beta-hydroxylase GntD [Streptomyces sp. WI04-05B]|uniref:guanitoxin biosynthesis L-enduracididine beta-hydroxylase GntD n=1 Tax=Streptomyces TaxID=1883 RepID=UPI0029AD9D7B|nr:MULTISPECIES: guanitoxin biosynthesis L-enduracididine beta-hydroxylase GntD [unclassified Streptomyces]MDX2547624.1 guanitoxin biosynthesis L-enduracididine beta-hydroxylase GntD [Streptomyces sp. WI04-05B]MDX2590120.1 guanitoxin biosynthesis L-enduracididine beta-hydroxylase GntD [Streptomyces sp. WI04-05A]MDX3752856.1 guanitoxin biosynthesis L-enduracididine beta-hydroxylase GntD [Streptomyces sp. AK08-02]